MPRQVLTPADRENIARWAAEGLSDAQIAAKLDGRVAATGVQAFRRRRGIPSGWVRPPNALERGEHGSVTTWNLGCKCDLCAAAHTARQKQTIDRLQERTAGGARQHEPWERWEDELLIGPREQGDLEILARYLGRSYSALVQRTTRARRDAILRSEGSGTLF